MSMMIWTLLCLVAAVESFSNFDEISSSHSLSCDPRAGYHRCLNNERCIPLSWLCNGRPDCPDGSDETTHCEPMGCETNEFQCVSDKVCLPVQWRCDNFVDCHDESDEENCEPGVELCLPSRGLYECSDLRACIPLQHVCDKKAHCQDTSDEGEQCSISCDGVHCAHDCVPSPRGPQCLCRDGYKLAPDGISCSDIDECSLWPPVCSQKCRNHNGGYNCSCHTGYELYVDRQHCQAQGPAALLLYSKGDDIMTMNLKTMVTSVIHTNIDVEMIYKMAVDNHDQKMYWTDQNSQVIRSMPLAGGPIVDLITTGILVPEDLSVDWIGRNLYVVDSGRKQILACTLDGAMCTVLVDKQLAHKPRALALYPQHGMMFWSDWGVSPMIMACVMDGTNCNPLVTTQIVWPNGLVIDFATDRLFWVDAKLDRVESVKLDGSNRKLHLDLDQAHPYFVAVFEDELYWSDWYLSGIIAAHKMTGKDMRTIVDGKATGFTVHVVHPVLQPKAVGSCYDSDCTHLCLLNDIATYTCACPVGMVLDGNGYSCKAGMTSPTLLMAGVHGVQYIFTEAIGGVQELHPLITNMRAGSIRTLAFDWWTGGVMYGDHFQGTISRTYMTDSKNSASEMLARTMSLWSVTDLAVDYVSGNIYWIDSDQSILGVTNSNGSIAVELLHIEMATSMTVSPIRSYLFYAADGGHNAEISRCDLTASNCIIIVDGRDQNRVMSLQVDVMEHHLYWISETDEEESVIFSSTLEGDYLAKIYSSGVGYHLAHCLDLTLHGHLMYWIEKIHTEDVIYFTNITQRLQTGTSDLNIMYSTTQDLYDVLIVDPAQRRNGTTICSMNNGGCSHLCLLLTQTTISCHCPGDMVLDTSGKNCQVSCLEHQFKCFDVCLPSSVVCDGMMDCQDQSDEKGCENLSQEVSTVSPNICPRSMYSCDTIHTHCIEHSNVCDGKYDCPLHDDERNCTTCSKSMFTCATSPQCIHYSSVCDTINNCDDASDELPEMCSIIYDKPQLNIQIEKEVRETIVDLELCVLSSMHQCPSGICLPADRVCDGIIDCEDASDEGRGCDVSCSVDDGGCDHICLSTPKGPRCACHLGYQLDINEKTCSDINECAMAPGVLPVLGVTNPYCSQICMNDPGTFNCSCVGGYHMDTNFNTCFADGLAPSLIIAVEDMIQQLDLDNERSLQHQHLFRKTDMQKVIAIAYDSLYGDVYWSELGPENDFEYSSYISYYSSTDDQVYRALQLGQCEGMAVDWISRNLYITVIEDPHLAVCSLSNLTQCSTLVTMTIVDKPRGIAVDPEEGVMFWTNWGKYPRIEKAWLSGEYHRPLVINTITWPNDVALDTILKRVYWVDSKLDKVESISYYGNDRRKVFDIQGKHPFGLSLFEDWLYWTDWRGHLVQANRFTAEEPIIVQDQLKEPRGIVVAHVNKQPQGLNRCENSPCSGLCVHVPESFKCLCPDGLSPVSGDQHKCEKQPDIDVTDPKSFQIYSQVLMALNMPCADSSYCSQGATCIQRLNGSAICLCPVGFTGLRCDNNTGIILSYPVLSDNNYGWIAGLMTIIVLTIIATLITIYCCKRKRHMTESDMISIIRFRSKIFGTEKSGVEQSTEALVQASFENPSFHREEDSESTGEERDTTTLPNSDTKVCMVLSPSEESIDSAFLSRHDATNEEPETDDENSSDTRPLTDYCSRAV